MNKYVGVKVLEHAEPMTRIAYNEFRGWKLPEDENGKDDGYLVVYTNGKSGFLNNQGQFKAVSSNHKLTEVQQLEQDLVSLLGYQDNEAVRLAQTALCRTNILFHKYKITGFPLFHNLLVNLGLKDRGLCCHWTEDLLQTLNNLELKKYRIIWAVSKFVSTTVSPLFP